MNIKKKNLKPIEFEASFKYKCPNNDCGYHHWLYLKEVQTKNFKVVCECGTVFKPKRIKNLTIEYDIEDSSKKAVDTADTSAKIDGSSQVLSRAINMMISLGYSKKESTEYVGMAFSEYVGTEDASLLVKKAITKIGGI
jgi:Holliday junction resolvasome RuvABC DNA-binding subunit